MENQDIIKVNNILIASTTSTLKVGESQNSPAFLINKDYYDFTLSILIARKVTNSIMKQFYTVAESDGITYSNQYEIKPDIVGMIGS